jgi:Purple acid Phosphatase, N-terminal domain
MNSTFLLPRSKSRQGFEPLLDEEDVQNINQRRLWASTCLIFLICVCFLSHSFDMHIWTFPTRNLPSTFRNDNIPPSSKEEGGYHDEHTLPTILSIIDPSTDKYINAIENTLYQELKALMITERRNLERVDRNFPLFLDKYIMYPLRQPLTIFWEPSLFANDPTTLNKDNLIALYCPADSPHANFLDAATIDQILATSRRHGGKNENEWYIPSFPITKHDTCEFRLFSRHVTKDVGNSNNVLEWMGSSPTLHLPAASRTPNNIHLALSHDPEEIVVQFQTGERGTPIAMFGIESDTSFQKVEGTTHTYRAEDLCAEPANVTEVGKFQDPGMIHVVRLTNLQPNTQYVYKVGLASGQGVVWSDYFNFQSPPSVGLLESFSFLVYGDQGCPEVGWGLGGAWTAAMAAREKGIRMVHHFGDLSYVSFLS